MVPFSNRWWSIRAPWNLHASRAGLCQEEPKNIRQEAEFVEGKILTRFTSSLDEVFGDLTVTESGLKFQEKGGIDFQPITVLVPGGEEFPFTFSSKALDATAEGAAITTSTDFEGTYRTPSYRTSNFIDPKGRALTTGVQYAQGLVALGGDDEQLEKDNNKRYIDGVGTMSPPSPRLILKPVSSPACSAPSNPPTPTWVFVKSSTSRSPASCMAAWKRPDPSVQLT